MSEDRFDELIAATDRVAPRADFTARVMEGIDRSDPNDLAPTGFWGDLPRAAKRIVPVALIAAAASAILAYRAIGAADEDASFAPPADQVVANVVGAIEEQAP